MPSDEKSKNYEWAAEMLGEGAKVEVVDAVASLVSDKSLSEIHMRFDDIDPKKKNIQQERNIIAAGEVFERVALNVLEKEIGEPDNPLLSKFLVNVMRHPREVLEKVKGKLEMMVQISTLEEEEVKKVYKTINSLAKDIQDLPKFPRNTDAIAYKNVDADNVEDNQRIIKVTGAYEMKGYKSLMDRDELYAIGQQIKDSKRDFYKSFGTFSKYYNIYKTLCATPEEQAILPKKIQLVDEKDFETTLVVPSNTSGVQSQEQIEQTLKVLAAHGCTSIKSVGIETSQIGKIKTEVIKKIDARYSKRKY